MENAVKIECMTALSDNAPVCRNPEERAAWLAEGRAAWEDYQRTGLHLANEEVMEWMDKIIAGEQVPMPKCHI